MSGRRLFLSHVVAEDRGSESGSPAIARRLGQMVQGYATFYIAAAGWAKIRPGRLDLSDLYGGASGFGSNQILNFASVLTMSRSGVEFYLGQNTARVDSFVALNGDVSDLFTFGFFGRRHS